METIGLKKIVSGAQIPVYSEATPLNHRSHGILNHLNSVFQQLTCIRPLEQHAIGQ